MSARRVLAGSALALLMPASLLAWSESGSASTASDGVAPTTSLRVAATQRVRIEVLPQIVHPGSSVASANAAKAAITATFRPAKAGRKVKLQVKRGSAWKTVSTRRQDGRGRAQFAAPASRNGAPLTYRAQAVAYNGLRAIKSSGVSTQRWLTPTHTDQFSGTTLSSNWFHRGGNYEPISSRNCAKGDRRATKVGGGALRLSVINDPDRSDLCSAVRGDNTTRHAYRLTGHVSNNPFAFKYGFAAARMKLHKARGQHTSFWMQPIDGNVPSSAGHEIDVIEYFGDNHLQGGLTSFIHRYEGDTPVKLGSWIKNPKSFLANSRDGWSKNYHVFSVQWTPTTLVFRIDGKETWRISGGISSEYQVPILSILASDYELMLMRDSQLPQHAYVDWIRIWETGR